MRLVSTCPASGQPLWEGTVADGAAVEAALARARRAFPAWARLDGGMRMAYVRAYASHLASRRDELARIIARETGKPLWEGQQEVASMIGKIELSIRAQAERAGTRQEQLAFGQAVLRHRPHGVMAVLGPFNFPGHLPNGHIVPALLAGDTVVFKPSELTPLVGETMAALWRQAGLPEGVFNLVQGDRTTGAALVAGDIDGLLFTGSSQAGAFFRKVLAERPHVLLALELGGNNPLIAWDGDVEGAASIVAHSAFITAGQRCTCARRLILPRGAWGDRLVEALLRFTDRLTVGQWDEQPEPALGPLISAAAAAAALAAFEERVAAGGKVLRPLARIAGRSAAFLSPGIIDMTGIATPDSEIFAPLLQIHRVSDSEAAIAAANDTRFGLAAGLISRDRALWEHYAASARAGILNWNRPTTGAAGSMPFGGIGASGNHRPSAYYAADYCAYPVASFEAPAPASVEGEWRGLRPVDRAGHPAGATAPIASGS